MQTRGMLLMKGLAVVSALALGGGYVWYRQKSAPKPQPVSQQSEGPAERSAPDTGTTPETAPPGRTVTLGQGTTSVGTITLTPDQQRIMMSSSKSGVIQLNPEQLKEGQTITLPRTMLPSSKTAGTIFVPQPDQEKKADEEKKEEEPPRVILSGSKSIAPLIKVPEQSQAEEP